MPSVFHPVVPGGEHGDEAPRRLVACDNCGGIVDLDRDPKCLICGRDIIPAEIQAMHDQLEQSYKERGLADSLVVIRPLMNAVVETISTLAPMFPRAALVQAMNEQAVFTLLVELETRGFRVVPTEAPGEGRGEPTYREDAI